MHGNIYTKRNTIEKQGRGYTVVRIEVVVSKRGCELEGHGIQGPASVLVLLL